MIDGLLGRPRLINQRDPQPLIVALARWANSLLVPALVLSMLILDGLLLLILVLCLCYPGKGLAKYLAQSRISANPKPTISVLHVDQIGTSIRRMFEWLEVTGPALGFLLTVGALLLAFEPTVFTERDTGRFTQAISLAMTATFAGLLMRILAFSADRIFERILQRGADDPHGFVTLGPESKPEQDGP
jgi:hypothetical protein